MIVARYILKEHIGPFFFGFAVITLVLVMDFILEVMQSIITKGVGAWEVLEIFGLNLAWMLALSVPMSVLVGTIMAYGRLASDSEILALKASGWSWRRLATPALIWGAAMAVLMFLFNNHLLPESNHEARVKMTRLAQKKPLVVLQPGVFNNQIPGYQIYLKEINPLTSEVKDVRIFEQAGRMVPRTISAPRGWVHIRQRGVTGGSSGIVFELFAGEVAEGDAQDPEQYRRVFFHRQKVTLKESDQALFGEESYYGEREMNVRMMKERMAALAAAAESYRQKLSQLASEEIRHRLFGRPRPAALLAAGKKPAEEEKIVLAQLRDAAAGQAAQKSQMDAYRVEIHKKYSLAAACFVFVLVGAPLGAAVRKGGFGTAAGLSLGFFIFYWACLIGGEELADRGKITPFWAMWFANLVLAGFGILYYYMMEKENRLRIWDWTQELAIQLAGKIKRIFQPAASSTTLGTGR
ncbi:MAG: LptF/LptG family permease [candidate division Zixibacteria bacterium]|nr:LptF/LptG family permease [candidate division Zixibacteria bacterium]